MPFRELLKIGRLGVGDLHVDAVLLRHLVYQSVRLFGKAPGINSDHPDGGVDAVGHVEKHHPVGLEAGDQRSPAPIGVEYPLDSLFRCPGLVLVRQFLDLSLGQSLRYYHCSSSLTSSGSVFAGNKKGPSAWLVSEGPLLLRVT